MFHLLEDCPPRTHISTWPPTLPQCLPPLLHSLTILHCLPPLLYGPSHIQGLPYSTPSLPGLHTSIVAHPHPWPHVHQGHPHPSWASQPSFLMPIIFQVPVSLIQNISNLVQGPLPFLWGLLSPIPSRAIHASGSIPCLPSRLFQPPTENHSSSTGAFSMASHLPSQGSMTGDSKISTTFSSGFPAYLPGSPILLPELPTPLLLQCFPPLLLPPPPHPTIYPNFFHGLPLLIQSLTPLCQGCLPSSTFSHPFFMVPYSTSMASHPQLSPASPGVPHTSGIPHSSFSSRVTHHSSMVTYPYSRVGPLL